MLKKFRNQFAKLRWFVRHRREIDPQGLVAWFTVSESLGASLNYCADGLAVQNNCDCLIEPRFAEAYRLSLAVNDWRRPDGSGYEMRWRYYMYCKFAELATRVEGDFVECGVYKGGYALAAMEFTGFRRLGRTFHLLDTFEGLSSRHLTETEVKAGLLKTYSHYEECYAAVCRTFRDYPVRIIRGAVPETLPQCEAEKIAFLSIDMNCVDPEVAALRHFWPRLASGAVVLHDDYGFAAHLEQKRAMDRLADELRFSILALPTGQAVIFKP